MYSSTLSLTFALDGDGWSTPHPGCFNTGTELEPFLGDWVGPRVGLQGCGKSHLSLGIRFPDCQSNRKLLYQLCCTNVIIKTQKSKFNFQIILTAVYCTSNYPVFALCTSFIHLVVCLTTGPKPLPKRALHIVRSRASSFK